MIDEILKKTRENIPDIKSQWNNSLPNFSLGRDTAKSSGQTDLSDVYQELVDKYVKRDTTPIKQKESTKNAKALKPNRLQKFPEFRKKAKKKNTTSLNSDNALVSAAEKYVGTPYVWGGSSLSDGGLDCSGFVYNVLKDAGHDVGRTTAQGYRSVGTAVSKDDLQPGDLVFYGKNGQVTHVGVYAGDGKILHSSGNSNNNASNPGKGVSVTNFNYRSDFIEARRV